jgi:hypothetical protein
MSNMKDYAMWLDNKGYALWDDVIGELVNTGDWDLYCDEMVEDYKTDKEWHQPEEDDDIIPDDEDDDEDGFLDDDELGDYVEWTPEEYWCSPDGVLTDNANKMLNTQDSKGELV